ncbi:MBL fold metallo-hydrolase RNA specificity domain-containing protein [Pseudidiomarina donghaiensis]|uniref:MBL fold metallo-hydrolase n=1 Tax=Pseudidiomarina donghaiensis TaxID=519452 RepID=A0A432XKV8_9GAMM|nr:MBL fold metallo-hydrolase [Pseudidiomarina donghaiensis]RUO49333.1 MBL fold metallo-hydrolase [Pseudidiomarina donghaiensis]SFV21012.1 metallo-beta-lactamase family protein [Pseudidiomarina donghaiensis]
MQQNKEVIHHGAGEGVTGSCHEFFMSAQASVLIDCGMFQGPDAFAFGAGSGSDSGSGFGQDINFSLDAVQALVITHCHIDHVGRLPALLAAGFRGPIYCTPATAALLPLVLEDAMKVADYSASVATTVLKRVHAQLHAVPLDVWVEGGADPGPDQGLHPFHPYRMRLRNAGHIMGSAYVEFESLEQRDANGLPRRVVFSGDLGCKNTPLLPDPTPLEYADLLVLESTYGDRLHESRASRRFRLKAVIEKAFVDRGAVLIPAFSIGRTQELLYEIEDLIHEDPKWRKMTVILDSPLASAYTKQYRRLKGLWDEEARERLADDRHPLNFERLHVVESHREHTQIVELLEARGEPAIVIAASGMCSGGRIMNYLKALIGDERTDVVFVGYQAVGTPGRQIQEYGPRGGYVVLDHQRYPIRAQIHTIGGYSAHADQRELLEFLQTTVKPVSDVRLVHGETSAKAALAAAIRSTNLITGTVS